MIVTEIMAYKVQTTRPSWPGESDTAALTTLAQTAEVSYWLPDMNVYISELQVGDHPSGLCHYIEMVLRKSGCQLKLQVAYVSVPTIFEIPKVPLDVFLQNMNIVSAYKYTISASAADS